MDSVKIKVNLENVIELVRDGITQVTLERVEVTRETCDDCFFNTKPYTFLCSVSNSHIASQLDVPCIEENGTYIFQEVKGD